jgi:hypothetical protein
MRVLHVGRAPYLTFVWPGGAQKSLVVHAGDHVLHFSIAIVAFHRGIKWLKAGGQDYRPYVYFYFLRFLLKIDGVILANSFANATFFFFKIKTTVINISDKWNCLRVVYMDGFVFRYFLIEWIGVFDRAVFYASSATRALVLNNVPGFFGQGNLEVS